MRLKAVRNRPGQGLVEYVLLITLVCLLLIGALLAFQGGLGNALNGATEEVGECVRPGQGGANPGKDGGDAPGLCDKG